MSIPTHGRFPVITCHGAHPHLSCHILSHLVITFHILSHPVITGTFDNLPFLFGIMPGFSSLFELLRGTFIVVRACLGDCSSLFGVLSLIWQSLMTELRLTGSRTASATYGSRPFGVCRPRKRSNQCRGMAAALSMDCSALFGLVQGTSRDFPFLTMI